MDIIIRTFSTFLNQLASSHGFILSSRKEKVTQSGGGGGGVKREGVWRRGLDEERTRE